MENVEGILMRGVEMRNASYGLLWRLHAPNKTELCFIKLCFAFLSLTNPLLGHDPKIYLYTPVANSSLIWEKKIFFLLFKWCSTCYLSPRMALRLGKDLVQEFSDLPGGYTMYHQNLSRNLTSAVISRRHWHGCIVGTNDHTHNFHWYWVSSLPSLGLLVVLGMAMKKMLPCQKITAQKNEYNCREAYHIHLVLLSAYQIPEIRC